MQYYKSSLKVNLPSTPLFLPELVQGQEKVMTIADPFPVSHNGNIYIFAEVEGIRITGDYFKKVGIFMFRAESGIVCYLGETWPEDDGEYSFPYVFLWEDYYYLMPDVNRPSRPDHKENYIYRTSAKDFPFGWSLWSNEPLNGACNITDKIIVRQSETWWLFVSDSRCGGRLLVFYSDDLSSWIPHKNSPLLRRTIFDRIVNKYISYKLYSCRPWRLGGSAIRESDHLVLPIQHAYRNKVYGEAVSFLRFNEISKQNISVQLSKQPVFFADGTIPWCAVATHHVAFVFHQNEWWAAIDGFDGQVWASTIIKVDGSSFSRVNQ